MQSWLETIVLDGRPTKIGTQSLHSFNGFLTPTNYLNAKLFGTKVKQSNHSQIMATIQNLIQLIH